ncbi:MAG: hypothetical protein KAI63_03730, partial [Planctomycetes bacterium]|nr:hypothetical protein [Planctomycetota bacterium]
TEDIVQILPKVNNWYKIDASIRVSPPDPGSYKGDEGPEIITSTPDADQQEIQALPNGMIATYYLKIDNEGNAADTVTLIGSGAPANWTVSYFDDVDTDITGQVTAGTYQINNISAINGYKEIKLWVIAGMTVPSGTTINTYLTVTSLTDPTKVDLLWARTGVSPAWQADAKISNDNSIYVGDAPGVPYEPVAPTVASTTQQSCDEGTTVTYYIKFQNDGNQSDQFLVTGPAGDADWSISYYYNGSSITNDVIGAGWLTPDPIGIQAEVMIEVGVTVISPTNLVDGVDKSNIIISARDQGNQGQADTVKAKTAFTSLYISGPESNATIGTEPVIIGKA